MSAQLDESFNLIKRSISDAPHIHFDSIKLAVEDVPKDTGNALHEMIMRAFKQAREKYKMNSLVHIDFHKRNVRKLDRIAALEPPIVNGWLAFNESLPEEFMRQMRQFPTGDFCDGPDALQGASELPVTRFPVEKMPNGMPSPFQNENQEPYEITAGYF